MRQLGRFDEAEAVLADAEDGEERHYAEQLVSLVLAKSSAVQPLDVYTPTIELAGLSIDALRAALPDPVRVIVDGQHTYFEAGFPGLVALRLSPHDIAVHVYTVEWTGPHMAVGRHPLLAQWSLAEVTPHDVEVALRSASSPHRRVRDLHALPSCKAVRLVAFRRNQNRRVSLRGDFVSWWSRGELSNDWRDL